MDEIEYIPGEVWMPTSSWGIERCEYSNTRIWPWQRTMKGISTEIRGMTSRGNTSDHMSIRTTIRWLTPNNHLMLKLAGKIS